MNRPSPEVIYDLAMSYVGTPYRWGGDNPMAGFDCSGFVIELYKAWGVLPHRFDRTSAGLWAYFSPGPGEARPKTAAFGRLAYYGRGSGSITHVAFCLNESLVVEAAGGNSGTTDRDSAIDRAACVRIRPIHYRLDFVGFSDPSHRHVSDH